jgi:hypothetical protein
MRTAENKSSVECKKLSCARLNGSQTISEKIQGGVILKCQKTPHGCAL